MDDGDDDDDDDDDLKFSLPCSTLYHPVESNFNDFRTLFFHFVNVARFCVSVLIIPILHSEIC